MLNEQLLRQVKCICTKMYVHLQSNMPLSTDLNVHLQKFMYTANIVKIYGFDCTLSKMKVHLTCLCAFLIELNEHL